MLFVTLNQHWIFLIILWYGVIAGITYKLGQIVCNNITHKNRDTKHSTRSKFTKKRKNTVKNSKKVQKIHKIRSFLNIFSKNTVEFFVAIMISSAYLVINYFYNYGEIRLYTILGFAMGIIIGKFVISQLHKLFKKFRFCKKNCVAPSENNIL